MRVLVLVVLVVRHGKKRGMMVRPVVDTPAAFLYLYLILGQLLYVCTSPVRAVVSLAVHLISSDFEALKVKRKRDGSNFKLNRVGGSVRRSFKNMLPFTCTFNAVACFMNAKPTVKHHMVIALYIKRPGIAQYKLLASKDVDRSRCDLHYENVGCFVPEPADDIVLIPEETVEVDFVSQPIYRARS